MFKIFAVLISKGLLTSSDVTEGNQSLVLQTEEDHSHLTDKKIEAQIDKLMSPTS